MPTIKAPAKINWFLHVTGKRRDGYHNIQSLMQCVSLYDTLNLEESSGIDVLTESDIPAEKNLVYKAALLLKDTYAPRKGVRIDLKKEIPIAAGLGGGSSDAAATLKGLNSLWGLDVPDAELASLAATLGSDIPFFISNTSAIAEGRGERITPIALSTPHTLLIVKPNLGITASWAYSKLEKPSIPFKDIRIKTLVEALEGKDYATLAEMASNDLEVPVVKDFPEIGELKQKLLVCGASVSIMSGSGSSVFGLFTSRNTAEKAVASFPEYWSAVVETL